MPWFRRKKHQEEQAPQRQPLRSSRPKRSRSRGPSPRTSRNVSRHVAGAGPAAAAAARRRPRPRRRPQSAADAGREARGRAPEAAGRRRASLRRRPREPRCQTVKKEIVISVEVGEQTVAVLEDGKPAEVYLGRPGHRSIAGNIYKGVVDNVLPGMEASFVDIGLEKNGFLYVDEIVVPELEGRRHNRKIQELVSKGQEVLVQAVKDPMGTKGARLTTEISLPGRFLVYTPFGDGIGVSRRLDDAERERLKDICKGLELAEGGIIVRTAAEGASREELEGDLKLLTKLWSTIKGRAERAEPPALVYQEAELPLRTIRDLFIRDFERVVVDHERTYRKIVGYLKRTSPELAARVERYHGQGAADREVGRAGGRVVDPRPARRICPPAATSSSTTPRPSRSSTSTPGASSAARGRGANARLEDTITKNNLEAVAEVVRQLRLRDIGGIIVIDFIDMANPKNRQLVEDALNRELARDRTKTYVVEISPLGLVEMTRQNVTDGPREILTNGCPACKGDGVVVSAETHAVDAERKLRVLAAASRHEAFLVELNSEVAGILIGPGGSRLDELEKETGRRFAFKTKKTWVPNHFAVVEKGKAAKIDPQAFPVVRRAGVRGQARGRAPARRG